MSILSSTLNPQCVTTKWYINKLALRFILSNKTKYMSLSDVDDSCFELYSDESY